MGTDRYAYQSRLRRISPMPKLLLTGSALVLCLLCDSVTVGLVTLLGMWGLVTALGGLSPRVFLRFLCIPMAFLAVGCVTILINSYPQGAPVLLAVPVKRDRKGLTELRRRVGIVFQDPDDQLFSADVYRDISFGAVNLGLPEAEVRRRVEAAMERTGVSHLRDKPTHALSFGQKKRVAIAGVLVMEPEALILDEPTAGLDPQGVSDLLELLTSLRDSQGMTILMATHDMDVVPLCCDYAYLLGGGSVLAQGTPEELFTKAELLRANHLRLPRIAHLMAILRDRDGLDVTPVGTIGAARRELLRLLKQEELL